MKIGTRGSVMAIAQTEYVIRQLELSHSGVSFEKSIFETRGDRDTTAKLSRQGGKGGAFVAEIRDAVRSGELHAAMHSLKDIPGNEETPGLIIAAYLERRSASDCLVLRSDRTEAALYESKIENPLKIGTTSVRRAAFLKSIYPGCETIHYRGSVVGSDKSRLHKLDNGLMQDTASGEAVGPADALVLASAGLERVGESSRIVREFSLDEMLPAIGQGIIVVECRSADPTTIKMLSAIDHFQTRCCALAEREVLWILNGHCNSPIAGHCIVKDGKLELAAAVMSLTGNTVLRSRAEGPLELPRELGRKVAAQLIADGANELIEETRES